MVALTLSLSLPTPSVAWAAGLTPEDAARRRGEIETEAQRLDAPAAVELLRREAAELGDPELFLGASERLRQQAKADEDEALAREAASLAATARDIALYLADERRFAATDWQVVTRERAGELADEAAQAIDAAESLADEIVAAREAAAASETQTPSEEPERRRKPGTGLIAGGAAALTIGVGGIAMLGAGMGMGAARQKEAEALDLPAEQAQLAELDRQGAQANLITYVGAAVAGVGLATGIALIVVGVKRRKQAGGDEAARVHAAPWFDRESAGIALGGRF